MQDLWLPDSNSAIKGEDDLYLPVQTKHSPFNQRLRNQHSPGKMAEFGPLLNAPRDGQPT